MSPYLSRSVKVSLLLGNLFEHYDNALFTTLSPFLAPLFFPGKDPVTALILTYCIIPLGMIARPIGALFFGYIGDTKGRKDALVISLGGMAIVTVSLGFMPTYSQMGMIAPILLLLGRIFQNFFASGEVIGGAILLLEHAPEKNMNFLSSLFNSSTIAGLLLASFGVSVLCFFDKVEDYWRILYLLGSVTAVLTCYIRLRIQLPASEKKASSADSPMFTTFKACWDMRKVLVVIAIASGFSYVSYSIALVIVNGFVPLVTDIPDFEMVHLNTLFLVIDFLLLPVFGILANRFSRDRMMVFAGLTAFVTAIPLFLLMREGSFMAVIFVRFCLVLIGVWFSAPFHAWYQQLVPAAHRYTVVSFGYAIGTQLLGSPAAAISLWLFHETQMAGSVAWYWMALGGLTSWVMAKQSAEFSKKLKVDAAACKSP